MPNTEYWTLQVSRGWHLIIIILFGHLAFGFSGQCSKANEWTNKSISNAFSDKYLNEQWTLAEWDIQ